MSFVLETKTSVRPALKTDSVYKMYYVCGGVGNLHTTGRIDPISEGDILFTFPDFAFAVESTENLRYMYIGFLGARGNQIMEQLGIDRRNFIFRDISGSGVKDIWENAIAFSGGLSSLAAESVLLYTFSAMAEKIFPSEKNRKSHADVCGLIRKYIDDHFTESDLSLSGISRGINYNAKYISSVFKKLMGVTVTEYLNVVRIQHACTMMQQGFISISDISFQCGYRDPQYFSRVFRKLRGISPSEFISGEISPP